MKIEIGESLAGSYLRHVERCWLVQANWKASEHWKRSQTDPEIEELFQGMKRRFDPEGDVFKKTKDAAQLLKQGELDIVGVDQKGGVHAMEVAFHEAGLKYDRGNVSRVLKKMLRALLMMGRRLTEKTGVPVTAGITGEIQALKAMWLRRLVVATPHEDELNARMKAFLEASGFEVLRIEGYGLRKNSAISDLPVHASYKIAKRLYEKAPEADGIFIPCPR